VTRQVREVTPKDSFVPIYEEIWTEEELAQREADTLAEQTARQVEEENKFAQKEAILERIGLTEEELQIVLNN
jgi:hypothetical protein